MTFLAVFWLVMIPLVLLDAHLFRKLMDIRTEVKVDRDDFVSMDEYMEELMKQNRKALDWFESRECAINGMPGGSIYLWIRDHWVRRTPWTASSAREF